MKMLFKSTRFKFNFAFACCLLFLIIASLSFVSAVSYPNSFREVLSTIFEQGWISDLLFERILIFLIFFTLVFVILSRISLFEDHKANAGIIALAVSLIGVRYLDYAWLETIVFQYGVLAVAINSILPFILYFFFLQIFLAEHPGMRKMGWILFAVVYFGLWVTSDTDLYGSIYWWTLVASLVVLFLDGTIQRYLLKEQMRGADAADKAQYIAKLERDIRELERSVYIKESVKNKLIREKKKRIKQLQKYL